MRLIDEKLDIEKTTKPSLWNIWEEIWNNLNELNLNYPSLVVGGPGSSKSITSVKYMEAVSRDGYNPQLVIFQPIELMNLITGKSGYKLRKGDIVVFDEAGLAISNKRWYSETNLIISELLQSFRYRNLGLFVTVPSSNYIDPSVRTQFLSRQHAIKVDQKKEQGVIRFYESQHNPIYSKTYNKHRRELINNEWTVISQYRVNRPRKAVMKEYEKMKDDYLTKFYEKRGEDMEEMQEKAKIDYTKPQSIDDQADTVLDNIDDYITTNFKQKFIDKGAICNEFKVGNKTANRIKSKVLSVLRKDGITTIR